MTCIVPHLRYFRKPPCDVCFNFFNPSGPTVGRMTTCDLGWSNRACPSRLWWFYGDWKLKTWGIASGHEKRFVNWKVIMFECVYIYIYTYVSLYVYIYILICIFLVCTANIYVNHLWMSMFHSYVEEAQGIVMGVGRTWWSSEYLKPLNRYTSRLVDLRPGRWSLQFSYGGKKHI